MGNQDMYLDPKIRDWVFIPIMIVMILVGLLRHHAMQLLNSVQKAKKLQLRETASLFKARTLRSPNCVNLPIAAFNARKEYFVNAFKNKHYLKDPNIDLANHNPMNDPATMQGTMDLMMKNMSMVIPQTLIMSWISFFFSGFVLTKLPFPLTLRFKDMLQRGIETPDMDVSWVSSISWYFLNLFGLSSVYTLLLGEDSAASGSMDMLQMQQMGQTNPMQQPQEVVKAFDNERELLELASHEWYLDGVELRILEQFSSSPISKKNK
ncbi:integral membrane protein DUF106-domain-containing protein [Globomyces pollinis-pini]|nr:integral membrane protein DUF106-domain-containing protein [Globomyces pollinis-pini]